MNPVAWVLIGLLLANLGMMIWLAYGHPRHG